MAGRFASKLVRVKITEIEVSRETIVYLTQAEIDDLLKPCSDDTWEQIITLEGNNDHRN